MDWLVDRRKSAVTMEPEVLALATLGANYLLQGMHHVDQRRLCRHYRVDILLGAGRLVDHAFVLAAFDTGGAIAAGCRSTTFGAPGASSSRGPNRMPRRASRTPSPRYRAA